MYFKLLVELKTIFLSCIFELTNVVYIFLEVLLFFCIHRQQNRKIQE